MSIDFEGILYGDTVNFTEMSVSMSDTHDLLLDVNENVLSIHNYIMGPLDGTGAELLLWYTQPFV